MTKHHATDIVGDHLPTERHPGATVSLTPGSVSGLYANVRNPSSEGLNAYHAPTRPQPGAVGPPSPDMLLPIRRLSHPAYVNGRPMPAWWWLGCHGGAGASTLATVIPTGADAGRYWPVPIYPGVGRVVLVARTHAHGLRSAQAAARQWASGMLPGHVQLLGLVVIADAPGRLPKPLRDLLRLISGGVPRTWEIPWVEGLRFGDPPARTSLPAAFAELASALQQITSGDHHV